jgi:hypothetical protein
MKVINYAIDFGREKNEKKSTLGDACIKLFADSFQMIRLEKLFIMFYAKVSFITLFLIIKARTFLR